MAITSCQLDCVWNKLHSKKGGNICHPDLEAGRNMLLMWQLIPSGDEKLRPKKLIEGSRIKKIFDFKDSLKQNKFQVKYSLHLDLVVHTFNLGHTSCWIHT